MSPPDLPFELQLTLRSGTVYYFEHRCIYSSEPHFFAVINADPQSNHLLILPVGSSQVATVQSRRKHLPPETLVIVDPAEYPDFSKQTIFDCNQLFELSREELVQKFKTKGLRHHRDLPKTILEKIWKGVHASPRVDEAYKQFLPPEEV
ncbi:MAG: hypothetical protein GXY61_11140 [Lentisphaerae bacterium]|jgi:hypothetical protein|nr:hypothetical protein [Lentisphaerota bacterium]